jgi:8-oxo-dGTP pyrophosphatase MutT (NUDIX family)
MAAIRPAGKEPGLWALPKGRIEDGDSGEATALREIAEETGAHGRSLGKLGDVKYVYTWPPRSPDAERIFKVVSFFLVRYQGGRLGNLPEAHRHEVAEAKWLALEDAPRLLAYGGEKDMARKAWERLSEDV